MALRSIFQNGNQGELKLICGISQLFISTFYGLGKYFENQGSCFITFLLLDLLSTFFPPLSQAIPITATSPPQPKEMICQIGGKDRKGPYKISWGFSCFQSFSHLKLLCEIFPFLAMVILFLDFLSPDSITAVS